MDIDIIRNYCAGKQHVTESFPFDDTTLVFKVKGRMFALLNLEAPFSVNLKCDPEKNGRIAGTVRFCPAGLSHE